MSRFALLGKVAQGLSKLGAKNPAAAKVAQQLGATFTDPVSLGTRYGLDGAFTIASGTVWAPPDATLGERAMLMGEDLLYGVGSSVVGQGFGGLRGARKYRKAKEAGKPITVMQNVEGPDGRPLKGSDGKVVQEKKVLSEGQVIDRNMGYGDMMAMPTMAFLPRPLTQGVYEAAGERANQTAQEVAAAEQVMNEQQIAASSFAAAERALLQAMYGVGA
jgi:hypothetical protein